MLKEIDDNLSSRPRVIATILLILFIIWKVPVALMMALLILPITLQIKKSKWLLAIIAVSLWFGMWLINGVSVNDVLHENKFFYHACFSADWTELYQPFLWLCSLPLALILSIIFTWILNKKKGHRKEIQRIAKGEFNADAKLSEKKLGRALAEISTSATDNGSILGVDTQNGESIVLTDDNANLHTLAIGTTGSGKTTTICNIIESAIQRQLPLFYVDGKGDLSLARKLESYAKKQNRPYYLFSMMGKSVRYNPLASGGITSKKDRIIELREWSEDHYRKIAEGYLQTVFSILTQCNQSIDLITLAKYLSPYALYDLARITKNQKVVEQIESLENKEKQISSLIAEIENIANSEIGHLFDCQSGNVLTLKKALEENAIVYFCLQPLAFPAYATSLGKLIINDLKALASSQLEKTDKKIIYTIFDEFSVFAGDQIINLINQGRSAGIHAVLSTQSLADIVRNGDEALLGQMLGNCNNYIIQRQNYHQDAEQLANIIGTFDGFQITSQVDIHAGTSGVGSVRQSKEYIIHPDVIKRLCKGEGIIVNKQKFRVQRAKFRRSAIVS